MTRLYLDHNATSPLRPACREAMLAVLGAPLNASSVHAEGRRARGVVDGARRALAARMGVTPNGVIFTGGGTEGDNAGIRGLVRGPARVRRLLIAATEHAAIHAAAARAGVPVQAVPVLRDGTLDLAALEAACAGEGPVGLALMLANNETGVVHPVAEAARIVHAAGGYVLCDAVQALFKVEFDRESLGADVLVLAAHKAGGPQGIGAMILRPGLGLDPFLVGGGQEENRRAGTHDVAAVAGFRALCEAASPSDYEHCASVRDEIEAGLPGGVTVWGQGAPRLPNTTSLTAPGFSSETQALTMDLAGIAVSAGSACSSGKLKPSGVLTAMGATEEEARCALRVSTGWDTPSDAGARFLRAWTTEHERIARRAA